MVRPDTRFTVNQIREYAIRMIEKRPAGVRNKEIVDEILRVAPGTPTGTVHTVVCELPNHAQNIVKPARGLLASVGAASGALLGTENGNGETDEQDEAAGEKAYYQPFADFLETDLGEASRAVPLGGAAFRSKWGTPDVLGVYKASALDLVKFQPEIISAEIKADPRQPVVAFGQVVAYRLFSTKTYLVLPNTTSPEDVDRLENLSILLGIGLVLFTLDPAKPDFQIRTRAQRFVPDMFYVNDVAANLYKAQPSIARELFGS